MNCRFCSAPLDRVFVDLGTAPPSNAYLSAEQLDLPETYFPLKLYVCEQCWLVQVPAHLTASDLFTPQYAYFSSFSTSWLAHAEQFVSLAVERLDLDHRSKILEVASNDGYLLQYVAARGIPCVGVEPTASTAKAARERGIRTIEAFFGAQFAERLAVAEGKADLLVANNVFAHVPDLNDFVSGLALALAPNGTLTLEFPHLQRLIEDNQFDTIYHEHFSYFSFSTAESILNAHGLRVWDVEELPTHGGSLRIWAVHDGNPRKTIARVAELRDGEASAGMRAREYYCSFQKQVEAARDEFLGFLIDAKRSGKRVCGYGAAAKGSTLLNFCGVRANLMSYIADASPHKQGKHLPGSRILIVNESRLRIDQPDFIVLLPWNLSMELCRQLHYVKAWGGKLMVAVPRIRPIEA
jgi:SAM-dependent methyltransferase